MTQSTRPDAGRAALASFVTNRLGRASTRPAPSQGEAKSDVPSSAQDFEKLAGYRELKLQRSAADLIGVANPFFRVHEIRAGATTRMEGKTCTNFSSYDYLGLNGHPAVSGAARKAIDAFGTSASASRIVAGERPGHLKLEKALAAHYGTEACVVMVSGHATNVTAIGAILESADVIFHDALIHNSVVTGAQLSGAQRRSFAHNDVASLEKLLEATRHEHRRALIVIEGLYSMDGDAPDLAAFVELKRRYDCWLMVDDAHGLGVLGRTGAGLHEHCGVAPSDVDIWMGTLSKTLSACGGYICGPSVLVEYLKCTAGGFVYSVGLSPPLASAADAALTVMLAEPERVERLRRNGNLFLAIAKKNGLNVGTSLGLAVIPVIVGDSLKAVTLSNRLYARGINVQPIIHPAVPERASRLRFFITSEHTTDQIKETVAAITEELAALETGSTLIEQLMARRGS
ncbi:aminotransferase class I/II-fold pyridoxal phosphate-dependent enzyme [Methylobacterium haplocladii]|uniref:8-amino-7-oxononanoate synthase n=1 Tax=Methylobacterium haplocladii TaxID=1176176 RepID=A0A512ISH3_9HYPH|nr:aminotransferase class I/II-fold pyridoxal phosphate-dependent enzyme [Methylobacterium haplocladii]GEP00662.1 8-amino-7-oxononanoate synthase [Methylobacterium haplocladii]GJD82442.1 8-amino-7-oxononanoate synthase [Methylobacterium haplocladii]GLS60365.1 8-amino-7-oxononanoate synthase [Methylobacterium haplocladii]